MRMTPYPSGANDNKEISHEEYLQCNKPLIDDEIKIEVYKGARTFGLVLVGGINNPQSPGDCGIYVSKVLEGGLAEVDGRILPGDRLMAIKQYLDDGDAYTFCFDDGDNVTHEDAKQLLRRCKGRVAIFIVRKEEHMQNSNALFDKTSQNILIEPKTENEVEKIAPINESFNQNKETNDSNYTNSHTSVERCSLSSQKEDKTIKLSKVSSSPPKVNLCKPNTSRIKLINLTTSKSPRNWFTSMTQNSVDCSLDYRDMAKYGIRPSSALSGNVIQPLITNIKVRRIKANWASASISGQSIQEDEEEELYSPSLPQGQNGFDREMEQRVL